MEKNLSVSFVGIQSHITSVWELHVLGSGKDVHATRIFYVEGMMSTTHNSVLKVAGTPIFTFFTI